jgi:Transposase DDE domain group 1
VQVTPRTRIESVQVAADATGVVSHAGTAVLVGLADRLGLTAGLCGALAAIRERRSAHDPGRVLRDLAVMLADGGDCLHDLGAIRDQADLFGRVASDATAWRVIDALDEERLQAVRAARRAARQRAWAAGAREGAWVAELDGLDLSSWPAGARALCRRERPHPGAQLSFTDQGGHRFQVLLTNQAGAPVALEARHRARARVEDAIRAAKDTGLRNLPFRDFAANAAWLELVLIAQDLLGWAQALLLVGDLARCKPKRLRYRLLHVAGRITRSGRRVRLHLPADWPWAGALVGAFRRLGALPAPG